MPANASRSPMKAELVSTTWPSSSSVPTARTEHENGGGRGRAGPVRLRAHGRRAALHGGTGYPSTRVIPTASHTAKSTKAR